MATGADLFKDQSIYRVESIRFCCPQIGSRPLVKFSKFNLDDVPGLGVIAQILELSDIQPVPITIFTPVDFEAVISFEIESLHNRGGAFRTVSGPAAIDYDIGVTLYPQKLVRKLVAMRIALIEFGTIEPDTSATIGADIDVESVGLSLSKLVGTDRTLHNSYRPDC